jgi:hypothetical protein
MFAIALLVESGCLIPQSIDAIPDAGEHPAPQIVVEQIPDYMLTPVLNLYSRGPLDVAESAACHCYLQMDLKEISEADPTITLEIRWFLDYDPNDPSSQGIHGQFDIGGTFGGDTLRPVDPFKFDPDLDSAITTGLHVVDVVIADQAGFDNTPNALLPNRSPKPGYQTASYRFAVQVNLAQDPAIPRCPNALPSVRKGCTE